MQLFLRVATFCFMGLALMASELTLMGVQHQRPTMRQPRNAATVSGVGKHSGVHITLLSAKRWADRLDAQAPSLRAALAMNPYQRWQKNIDLDSLCTKYSDDLSAHVEAVTALFKMRRQAGGFQKCANLIFKRC